MTKAVSNGLFCIAAVLLASRSDAQTTFNFDSAGGWTSGQLSGLVSNQLGWNADGQWFVDSGGTGSAFTDEANELAVYSQPITLTNPSDSFGFTMNFQFGGGPYATPTNFTYLMKAGLTESSNLADATGGAGGTAADANLQISSPPLDNGDAYRLLNNFMTIPGIVPIEGTQINAGDVFQYDYNITLGADAASTEYTVQLQNLTDGTDTGVGSVLGIEQTMYDALTGTGAYAFFQNLSPGANDTGLNGFQVNSIGMLPNPPAGPSFRNVDFAGPSFSDGGLNGQQGWNSEAGWNVADAAGTGNATTSGNTEIAVFREPINLAVGETFGYEMEFEFSGAYTTPEAFSYIFSSGLKTDATADAHVGTGDQVAADANIQILDGADDLLNPLDNADKYRLLTNFKSIPGTSILGGTDPNGTGTGDGTELNEGDRLKFEYEITLGADAASTTYKVLLQNLTDGTSTGIGEVDNHTVAGATDTAGIHPDLYAALTGDGAHMFFQTLGLAGPGYNGLIVHSITGDLPEPQAPMGDFDGDGDVDGADFLRWQRDGLSSQDLADWQASYGSSALSSAVSAVPEPSALALLSLGCFGLLRRRL